MSNNKNYIGKEGLTYLWGKIKALLKGKVDAIEGQGLSQENFTTDLKNKLDGIASNADNVTFTKSLTSGTKVGTININGTPTDIYCEKNTDTHHTAKNVVAGTATGTTDTITELANDSVYMNVVENGAVRSSHKISGSGATQVKSDTSGNIVIHSTNTTYSNATTSAHGLMSTADKTKLNGIATNAQVNVLEKVKVNGTAQTVTNKEVNISVPTNNNQLTNGAGYQTASQVTSAINSAIAGITSIKFEVVTSLPTTGVNGTIYLKASTKTETNNIYDEYIYLVSSNKWEKIGSTTVDLTNYLKNTDLVEITNEEIDAICI